MSLRRLLPLVIVVCLVAGACTTQPAQGYEQLTDISGVEQLSTEFRVQDGSTRLILLLSPT